MRAQPVTAVCTDHGEGPVWNPETGQLLWVDMLAGDVVSMAPPTGHVSRTHVGAVAAVLRPTSSGGLVLAVERGFAFLPPGQQEPVTLPELWQDTGVRMNDGGCDPQGRFYAGSMAYDEGPGRGRLWRLDHDGTATAVLDGVTISNGLVWSHDGHSAYYVDTPTQRVDVFDFDAASGTLHNRRPLVSIPEQAGSPDGMTLDEAGRLWVALWGGSAVHCYDQQGQLLEVVDVPARQVTACAFGGPDLADLYITTSRTGLTDPEPLAGAVFSVRPGTRGVPVLPFTGPLPT
ncbi:SMP-30/gluconolactonase/LRE family protein [Goodfellowiella coeruleoviolacea]|uniref:Sugar lactone lactonase YvrE n=1 Tax=Goodfellowiella coeruleoviolacea TaxID=334858 RepID=A0AAE3G9M6_9PSEU|nr:SMP-30/gluconolactonase/LRE family protein [Goodfellowiella coeruleoviolacea]MCP2164206.1 Sugar lactone lactonase YvrE [Goodfellowiella coeruleoviolacea]